MNSDGSSWLLSLAYRIGTEQRGFKLNTSGNLTTESVYNLYVGVRSVISLNHETTVADGDGTATNPWAINE